MFFITVKRKISISHIISGVVGLDMIHGHMWEVIVKIYSEKLYENEMVLDFEYIHNIINPFINQIDFSLLYNKEKVNLTFDKYTIGAYALDGYEPTTEYISYVLSNIIRDKLKEDGFINRVKKITVEIVEDRNSSGGYSIEDCRG